MQLTSLSVGMVYMIEDRFYMRRDSYSRPEISVLKYIIIANIMMFLLENVTILWFRSDVVVDLFALSRDSIIQGFFWTFLSYSFLHSTTGVFHILFNMILVFFMGRVLEPVLGGKRFLMLYLVSAFTGGLLWLLLNFFSDINLPLVGASASAMGLLIYFCLLYPNREVTVLLFFVIPLNIKPKWLAFTVLGVEVFSFLIFELPGNSNYSVANSAHLGGMLGAFLMYNIFQTSQSESGSGDVQILPPEKKKKFKNIFSKNNFKINITNSKNLKEEVDKILDKINTQGFASLTEEEKKTLDKAKDLLNN